MHPILGQEQNQRRARGGHRTRAHTRTLARSVRSRDGVGAARLHVTGAAGLGVSFLPGLLTVGRALTPAPSPFTSAHPPAAYHATPLGARSGGPGAYGGPRWRPAAAAALAVPR